MKQTLLTICTLLISLSFWGQDYYLASPEGYGAAATGGGDATPVIVTTYEELKSTLKLTTPQVILISGTITIPSGGQINEVIKDKSIIGISPARLVNNTQTQSGSGILNLKNGSNNIIIRNIIFEGPGAYDVDGRDNLTSDGCTNLWVDHCEFQDGMDGNFDIKGNSDNITVSWCKFTYLKPPTAGGSGGSSDHRYSNLVGSSDSDFPPDGQYSVTFQSNYWAEGCKERMPRARNAQLHILNCYYNTDVSSSRALGFSGGTNTLSAYVENSDFDRVGTVYQSYGGTVNLNFVNSLEAPADRGGDVPPPTYDYTVIPVEDVETYVSNETCGAGATLRVTTAGEISACNSLGLEDISELQLRYYPTVVKDNLYIELPKSISYPISVKIYSISGQEMMNYSIQNANKDVINLKVSNLQKGLYFCKVQLEHGSSTIKLIKD